MLATSRSNLKIAYGFIIVSAIIFIVGAVAYANLQKVKDSFQILDESVSRQILSIEEIRSNYSFMLLELTTFLLLDFNDQDTTAVFFHLDQLKNEFSKSLSEFSEYFISHDKSQHLSQLEDTGNRSLVLINQIIELRFKENKSLVEILPLKRNLKEIEADAFFSLVDTMIFENKSKIEHERRVVETTLRNSLFAFTLLVFLSFVASVGIGYIVFSREKMVDQFRDQLISITSHQLKSPLTVMRGNIELLEERNNLSVEERNAVSDFRESTENLLQTVNDFLDLSKIEGGQFKLDPEKTSLVGLISTITAYLKDFAEKNNIAIDFRKPENDFYIFVDESRLTQAINNIIDNAIKYSKDGGRVEITVRGEEKTATLAVKDDGMGIPKRDQKMIFEKFFRASNTAGAQAGSGLGLFLVKKIVEQSGGKIWFESQEGAGTTFFVRLPKYV